MKVLSVVRRAFYKSGCPQQAKLFFADVFKVKISRQEEVY
jgi:hypothetical protein